jgi:hypothetical protein
MTRPGRRKKAALKAGVIQPQEIIRDGAVALRRDLEVPDREAQINDNQSHGGKDYTPSERAKMFVAWCHKQEYAYVAEMCGCDSRTAARYRNLDGWDAQLEEIQLMIANSGDSATMTKTIQIMGELSAMRTDAYLCATRTNYRDARQAVQSYLELAKLELELRKPISKVAESLLTMAKDRYLERRAKERKPSADAQIDSTESEKESE